MLGDATCQMLALKVHGTESWVTSSGVSTTYGRELQAPSRKTGRFRDVSPLSMLSAAGNDLDKSNARPFLVLINSLRAAVSCFVATFLLLLLSPDRLSI